MKTTSIAIIILGTASLLGGCNSDKTVGVVAPPQARTPAITDGSLMTPGTPKITPLAKPAQRGQVIPLEWNMFWGENGHDWTVYVDGVKLGSGKLRLNSPQGQTARLDVELDQPGQHQIKVSLCNDHGCTDSQPMNIDVPAAG